MMEQSLRHLVLMNMLCHARQCWEQGICGMALYELGDRQMFLSACEDMITRQNADGRLCTIEGTRVQTDPALCMQSLLHAWRMTGKEGYRQAAMRSRDFYLRSEHKSSGGVLYHILGMTDLWADSAAMLPASMAIAGETAFAVQQMTGLCDALRLPNGLYGHRWNAEKKEWVRSAPWAAGNGWILSGLAWTMRELGKQSEYSPVLMKLYMDLTEALKPWRLPSGLYRDVLDDPESFEECQAATMQAYSQTILAEAGFLPETVLAQAQHTLETVSKHVDALGAIHDCPGSPDFAHNGTSTEMQAFWLMLDAALKRTGKGSKA